MRERGKGEDRAMKLGQETENSNGFESEERGERETEGERDRKNGVINKRRRLKWNE